MNSDERTGIGVIEYIGTEEQQALYRQLGTWCILGARMRQHEDANALFEAWQQTVHERDRWKCDQHFLIAKAAGGEPQWGIRRMEELLALNPDDEIARIGVGLAMLLGDMDGWREPIDQVLATSMDQYARQVALRTINVVAVKREQRRRGSLRPS